MIRLLDYGPAWLLVLFVLVVGLFLFAAYAERKMNDRS